MDPRNLAWADGDQRRSDRRRREARGGCGGGGGGGVESRRTATGLRVVDVAGVAGSGGGGKRANGNLDGWRRAPRRRHCESVVSGSASGADRTGICVRIGGSRT